MNKEQLQAAVDAVPYWYHRIELPHGIVTPGWAPIDASRYGLPERLDGEHVLDVGTWDGYWAFEAKKRGAKTVDAMEDFSDTCGKIANASRESQFKTFDLCCTALRLEGVFRFRQSIESYVIRDPQSFRKYDRVFMFGVLYHVRNPLLALTNCFNAMRPGATIHVETAILDNLNSPYTGEPHNSDSCYSEFYPADEFGMNQSNWWVPTLRCAAALLQAAGFKSIETWKLTETPRSVAECRGFLRAIA